MEFKTYPRFFLDDPVASAIASAIVELVDRDEYDAEATARSVSGESSPELVYVPLVDGPDVGLPEAVRQLHQALEMIAQRGPRRPEPSTFIG